MTIRFAYVTDSHYHPTAQKDFGPPKMLRQSRKVLAAMVPAINSIAPDFVVHGGDLLCGGGAFEISWDTYLQSVADVAESFRGFEAPFHCVPGNHDCDAERGTFGPLRDQIHLPELLDVVEVAPRLRLALANPFGEEPLEEPNGVWTDALDGALREAAAKAFSESCALILVLHPWVLPGFVGPGDDPGAGMVKGAERLLETVAANPSIVAIFTGHRHLNRIRMYRDFLIVDTACLIGYPMGFREICLTDDGFLAARFHQLDLPDLLQASWDRSIREVNDRFEGEVHDKETTVLLPRLRELWS